MSHPEMSQDVPLHLPVAPPAGAGTGPVVEPGDEGDTEHTDGRPPADREQTGG